jgi:hypothetical protein
MLAELNEAYEAEVTELAESFLTDIEADFAELNEAEAVDNMHLIPVIDTLLENLTDGDVLESVVGTLESYEELYEAEAVNANDKKKNLLGKVKNFAKNLWDKFKSWMKAANEKIGKMKDKAKQKLAKADLKNKAKARMKNIKEKIAKSKKGVMSKIKGLISKKKKPAGAAVGE